MTEEDAVLYALGGDPQPGMVFRYPDGRSPITADLTFTVSRVDDQIVFFRFDWPSRRGTFGKVSWPLPDVRRLLTPHTSG